METLQLVLANLLENPVERGERQATQRGKHDPFPNGLATRPTKPDEQD